MRPSRFHRWRKAVRDALRVELGGDAIREIEREWFVPTVALTGRFEDRHDALVGTIRLPTTKRVRT